MPAASASSADYESVSAGDSGHAESVQIVYDPAQVTYGQILQVFFSVAHDPTQLNRQGPDTGTQYRSAIFYTSDAQKKIAEGYIAQLDKAGVYPQPHRDARRSAERLLRSGGLSPGLPDQSSDEPVHRLQRSSEGAQLRSACCRRCMSRSRVTVSASKRAGVQAAPRRRAPAGERRHDDGGRGKQPDVGRRRDDVGAGRKRAARRPKVRCRRSTGATGWLNSKPLTPRACAARSWSSISGRTRASTACARCRT